MNTSKLKCDVGLYENSCCYKCANASKEGFPHPLASNERFEFRECPFFLVRGSIYQKLSIDYKGRVIDKESVVIFPQELHTI